MTAMGVVQRSRGAADRCGQYGGSGSRAGRIREHGGLIIDQRFFPRDAGFRGLRARQMRSQGGDVSSDPHRFAG